VIAPPLPNALGLALVSLVLGCASASQSLEHNLADDWEFRRAGDDQWLAASVPGSVHLDLLAHGLIDPPFDGDNEARLQWIERENWEYRTSFVVDSEILAHENLELVFQGLDTYAQVRLNGDQILSADNMFRTWMVQVGDRVRAGRNTLEITFRSPIVAALPQVQSLGYTLPAGSDLGDPTTRVFTRKAAYHYGWDWGPRFVTSGVWRPVVLRAWSGARIADLSIVQRSLTDERAELSAVIEVQSDSTWLANLSLESPDGSFSAVGSETMLSAGRDTVVLNFTIDQPQRWWPNGLGEAHLYDVIAELAVGGAEDRARQRIGLRTLEVVNQPDSIGESFFLRVNGVPAFMKGANYIPLDHFVSRVDQGRYRRLFDAVVDANMNMLRVWGGGIYEDDLFYDLADQRGILIWQDFMFANGMFPGDPQFLANIGAEAVDNIRRLRNHPSVALWCGNNEIDEGWHNWGWQRQFGYTPTQASEIWATYEQIFHQALPDAVETHDPGRFYWPSSPSIGWGHVESLTQGDSHYWGVWYGNEPFSVLEEKLPRFISEFGFQSYPSLETVRAFTAPGDRSIDSPVMRAHQKRSGAIEIIDEFMGRWYREPKDFESFLYVSQLLQAEGMKLAFEGQRRAKPRTMGTLYWQLNDTWPVASWSSIDYYGRWKALHYFTRDAFAEVLVSPVVRGDSLEVHVVSDRLAPVTGDLELATLDFQGGRGYSARISVTIPGNESRLIFSVALAEVLGGSDRSSVVLEARLMDGETIAAANLLYFARPKHLTLPEPDIEVRLEDDAGLRIRLQSPVLAKNVYLRVEGAEVHFSDNFFDLLPGREHVVRVSGTRDLDLVRGGLRIRTLMDSN
jgi:beta-mannosidase